MAQTLNHLIYASLTVYQIAQCVWELNSSGVLAAQRPVFSAHKAARILRFSLPPSPSTSTLPSGASERQSVTKNKM